MKPETYVGIALLALFVAATALSFEVMEKVVFMIGCFAVGWNIPDAAKAIVNTFKKKVTA